MAGHGNTRLSLGRVELHYAIERRQGQKIACIEEIAWQRSWIDDQALMSLAEPLMNCGYGSYLMKLVEQSNPDR